MEPIFQETLKSAEPDADTDGFNEWLFEEDLGSWVADKARGWRDHYQANYDQQHQEFYRLWRGIYQASDKTRDS